MTPNKWCIFHQNFFLAVTCICFKKIKYCFLIFLQVKYLEENVCSGKRFVEDGETMTNCMYDKMEHTAAFRMLSFAQLLAGIAAAPFNTIAYVYIDDNLKDKNKSPFYLGNNSTTGSTDDVGNRLNRLAILKT